MPTSSIDNKKIKHMMPRKNSRYHQGVIDPKSAKKYFESVKKEPIIYRSGLELQFISYCENNKNITKWISEPIKIEYYSRLKKKIMNYYPDYIIENIDGMKVIVEVKPYEQTIKPKECSSIWLKQQWVINTDKWKAAKQFADKHNMKFVIVTEKFFDKV